MKVDNRYVLEHADERGRKSSSPSWLVWLIIGVITIGAVVILCICLCPKGTSTNGKDLLAAKPNSRVTRTSRWKAPQSADNPEPQPEGWISKVKNMFAGKNALRNGLITAGAVGATYCAMRGGSSVQGSGSTSGSGHGSSSSSGGNTGDGFLSSLLTWPAAVIGAIGSYVVYDNFIKTPNTGRHQTRGKSNLPMLVSNADVSTEDLRKYYKTMEKSLVGLEKIPVWKHLKKKANNPFIWSQDAQDQFAWDAMNVRPIIHEDMVELMQNLLKIKRSQGSWIEKEVYGKLNIVDLMDRLLTKRPAYFYTSTDHHLLPNGRTLKDLLKAKHHKFTKHDEDYPFDIIGTRADPGLLHYYMSYDEMLLASLLTVSSPVQTINSGSKFNRAEPGKPDTFQTRAIYVAQVGSRFERPGKMEHKHMIAGYNSKDHCPDITRLFEKFYRTKKDGHGYPLPDNKSNEPFTRKYCQFSPGRGNTYNETKCPRLPLEQRSNLQPKTKHAGQFRLSEQAERFRKQAEIHLNEGQYYGDKDNQDVRIYAVGLGDGCWIEQLEAYIDKRHYTQEIIRAYIDLLRTAPKGKYDRITVVEFNYIYMHEAFVEEADNLRDHYKFKFSVDRHGREEYTDPSTNVKFVFHPMAYEQRGCPFVPCKELIVANMAWDGNSWLGNEYWDNLTKLAASGDPAAACCSTFWATNNPVVNGRYLCGQRTVVALRKGGFQPLKDFLGA